MGLGPVEFVLFAGMLIASWTDLRTMRIPNALTFSLMLAGVLTHVAFGDWKFGLEGLFYAFVIWYLFAVLGIFAPGDGKLMMGVGAMLGRTEMIEATFASLVLFLPVGLATLAVQGRLGNFIAALRWTAMRALNMPVGDRPEPTKMPHGPMLTVATVVAHYTHWFEYFQ